MVQGSLFPLPNVHSSCIIRQLLTTFFMSADDFEQVEGDPLLDSIASTTLITPAGVKGSIMELSIRTQFSHQTQYINLENGNTVDVPFSVAMNPDKWIISASDGSTAFEIEGLDPTAKLTWSEDYSMFSLSAFQHGNRIIHLYEFDTDSQTFTQVHVPAVDAIIDRELPLSIANWVWLDVVSDGILVNRYNADGSVVQTYVSLQDDFSKTFEPVPLLNNLVQSPNYGGRAIIGADSVTVFNYSTQQELTYAVSEVLERNKDPHYAAHVKSVSSNADSALIVVERAGVTPEIVISNGEGHSTLELPNHFIDQPMVVKSTHSDAEGNYYITLLNPLHFSQTYKVVANEDRFICEPIEGLTNETNWLESLRENYDVQHRYILDNGIAIPCIDVTLKEGQPESTLISVYGGFDAIISESDGVSNIGALRRAMESGKPANYRIMIAPGDGGVSPGFRNLGVGAGRANTHNAIAAVVRDSQNSNSSGKVALTGYSNGGTNVAATHLRYFSDDERVSSVVMDAPLSHEQLLIDAQSNQNTQAQIPEMLRPNMELRRYEVNLDTDPLSIANGIDVLEGQMVIISGAKDPNVNPDHARILFDALVDKSLPGRMTRISQQKRTHGVKGNIGETAEEIKAISKTLVVA